MALQKELSGVAKVTMDLDADEGYSPKNILITGGAGFIGSHVVTRLVAKYPQYKIVVFDKLDYCASLANIKGDLEKPNCTFVRGDIQVADLVSYVLQQHDIDTVMHFAAQSHVDNSFGNSLAFTMNNTYGTHVLLESCRMYGKIKRFINVSTDEVYGETSLGKEQGLDETSMLEPTNPYSAAKAGAEMMARAYLTSYKMPVIVTRGNNVYGPRQFPEKLIPKFTLLAKRGEQLPVHGDGEAVRSYLHVSDVAAAFDTVLHKGLVGHTYNIGTQKERSVLDVASTICKIFGLDPTTQIKHVRDRAFNDQRYYISDAKMLELGWREEVEWESGIKQTVDWFLEHGFSDYWDNGNVEAALSAHPTLQQVHHS